MSISIDNLIVEIFKQGLHGDSQMVFSWVKMYESLLNDPFPENLADFKDDFDLRVTSVFSPMQELFPSINQASVIQSLDRLESRGVVQRIAPYNEYRLNQTESWLLH